MFKLVDINMGPGPILNFVRRFARQFQATVEHQRVTNGTVADMARGDVVYGIAGRKQVALAQGDALATVNWVGVMAEPTPAGEQGVMRTDGYAYVRFETELTLTEGEQCFVSATDAGAATNVAPGVLPPEPAMGLIADAQAYTNDNPFAYVILDHCCPAQERGE